MATLAPLCLNGSKFWHNKRLDGFEFRPNTLAITELAALKRLKIVV